MSNTTTYVKNILSTVPPTVNDDINAGITNGCRWTDETAEKDYICLNNAAAAARWVRTSRYPPISLDADQLLSPNNSDWIVNALAPLSADSNNAGLSVRLFDDTLEEGVGFNVLIPAGVKYVDVKTISRAETAPAGARTVGLKLYNRAITDNGSVDTWASGILLDDIDIPTNENFQYDTYTITLPASGITAGELTQFELTRVDPVGGTELSGDWALLRLDVEFV